MVWLLVGALAVAVLLFVGLFVYFDPPPGSNCNDGWVHCPIGPGETPLGTTLAVGNGSAVCPTGPGPSTTTSRYVFALTTTPSEAVPSATDVSFQLTNSTLTPLRSPFLVTLDAPGGAAIGTWNSSSSAWTAANASGTCSAADCPTSPLVSGETLIVRSGGSAGAPFDLATDRLVIVAIGGGYTGTVAVPITGPTTG